MRALFRNFFFVLKRFKTSGILNIVCLSAAFASFLVLMMQVNFEKSFDRCHPNADRIYRVDVNTNEGLATIHTRPFIEAIIQSSSHIEAGTLINPYIGKCYLSVSSHNTKKGFKETVIVCSPEITKIFGFHITEGVANCLSDPKNVIIPESMSHKLFGNLSAIGRELVLNEPIWNKQYDGFMVVGAVYKDFPDNTQLDNCIYTAIADDYSVSDWNSSNYLCYLLLGKGASPEEVATNFNSHFDFSKINNNKAKISLTPLTDVYFLNQSSFGNIIKSGNPETPGFLFVIGLLVLLIAAINFTNFSTALSPMRMRSINTQKVLGSSDSSLRFSILTEAVLISLVSYFVALIIVYILKETNALPFVRANIALSQNIGLLAITGGIAVLVGIVAGLYPSWYMTSFQPAVVLKGSFGLSPSGRKLRTTLIGFQFIISIMLIITALFMRQQNLFMQRYPLGFDKDQIAVVELNKQIVKDKKDIYVNKLKEYPEIVDVAFSQQKFGASDSYRTWGAKFNGQGFGFTSLSVSWNFLDVMGIPVTEGRKPEEGEEAGHRYSYIINKKLQQNLNAKPDEFIFIPWMKDSTGGPILGVVNDIKFASLRKSVDNMAFVFNDDRTLKPMSYVRVRAGSNFHEVVEYIRKTVSEIDPTFPVEIEFYDNIFSHLYHQERNISSILLLFSILAVILSVVGVFGLIVFETQTRKKEIAIRKIHGASIREILAMFNKTYLKIVLVCFVIAAPVSWFIVHKWLEKFAYKTPMYWWIFIVTLLIVTAVTALTVTFQNWRAATVNPVDMIKNE